LPCCGNWCVVQTHSQAERWADANLRRSGYRTYLPMAVVRRRDNAIRSLWHRVDVPLFPSYLFLQHANRDLWRPIRETPGVLTVLKSGNQIQYVRAGVVEAVQAAEVLASVSHQKPTQWAPGASVALANGPLANHPAVVLSVHRDTATLGVMIFGALRQVQAPIEWLMPRD
jgi:transcription antitermination factor NusG